MVQIHLYQPKVVDVTIDFPTDWNELSLTQLHLVAENMLYEFKNGYEASAGLFLQLLKNIVGNKVPDIQNRLDAEDITLNGLPAMESLMKENNLTRQPYKRLTLPWKRLSPKVTLYGPDDDFNNLTCGEFEDAEIYFHKFREEASAETAANLVAVLFRPKNKKYLVIRNGEYINYKPEKFIRRISRLKPWILYAIFLWYAGCREQLPKLFPEVYAGGSEDSENADPLVFTNCIHHGAGVKNGSRNQIRMTLLKEFLHEMKLQMIEAEKVREEAERNNRG